MSQLVPNPIFVVVTFKAHYRDRGVEFLDLFHFYLY